jgi:hypothetical protein
MVTDVLVTDGIREGARLLRALDDARFPVTAALWHLRDGRWRYIVATPLVDIDGPIKAYSQINEVLHSRAIGLELSNIAVARPQDPLITSIASVLHTDPKDVVGIRFTEDTIDRTFVEGAYIYRASLPGTETERE